jgi:TIR domain
MQSIISWDEKPATVTTETFKRIKDLVLELKENSRLRKVILTPKELRQRLEKKGRMWKFSDAEMMTAIGHLENHGYVRRLVTSKGETRILLVPELLNNLAASFVLEARLNQEGLGSLEEQRLLSDGYNFPELEKLAKAERDILLDSGAVLFLEHNVCFRETNPLNNLAYLVFPELINIKKPQIGDDTPIEDGVAYTVSGAVENVYASLVVLMGYTQTFTRTNHWQNHALYEVGKGLVCGFRLEEERAGELDFVLYFGTNTPIHVRTLFQSLFENFLARRKLIVRRFEPVLCPEKHTINRSVVRELMSSGSEFAFCSRCGKKVSLPKVDQPIHLTKQQIEEVEANHLAVDQRSRFEQVLFRLKSYITDQGIASLECFISYAWGNTEQELWVERNLATDLQKAGIKAVLDRWENARIGASVPRFVERVGKSNRVIVVGTPLYLRKYDNEEPMGSFVLAAEGDLIGKRMIGTEKEKESILPILLEGTQNSSFPLLLQSRVYADFRNKKAYFVEMFKLILSIYQIKNTDPVARELNESLAGKKNLAFSQAV